METPPASALAIRQMVDNSSDTKTTETDWRSCLPANCNYVQNITDEAVWSLSSCKVEGFGINQLLDDRVDLYWQSDGAQPHLITIEFQRKTDISFIVIYLDSKMDESYTPSKIQVRTGNSILDLEDPITVNFHDPSGWQLIDLRENDRSIRAFCIVIQIIQNHQNGRDTHVRGIKVLGPGRSQMNYDKKFNQFSHSDLISKNLFPFGTLR